MEKRLLLAVVMMTAAILLTNVLFPPPRPSTQASADSAAVVAPSDAVAPLPGALVNVAAGSTMAAPADSVVIVSDLYRYVISTRGGAVLRAELLGFPSYSREGETVQLVPDGTRDFLSHRLAIGNDTVQLAALPFIADKRELAVGQTTGSRTVDLSYTDPSGFGVTMRYSFDPATYLISVAGQVQGLGGRSASLLTKLGQGMEVHEHPDHHSERELAYVTRASGDIDRVAFRSVEESAALAEPFEWVAIKDKFFVTAVVAGADSPLHSAIIQDVPDVSRAFGGDTVPLPQVAVTSVLPVEADGSFAFQSYVGPQDYELLQQVGLDLEEVTPYGYRWLQPFIRPLAAAVLWVLNTLHGALGIAYGWVLVIFGVMMRIVLWPLNAKAMRAQMKNMGTQPLLQEIRDKYKNDPEKQKEAMLALYKEHGFNPFAGCLPMLVPMPVLITLFFVFQNTIAFRGAEFLWLPDLSLRDPFYILPLVMIVSMFALQWVSTHLSGIEQNAQMKMMMYMMPIVMGFIFFVLPAGLNLYYAVTQVASVPQQILIALERKKATEEMKRNNAAKAGGGAAGGAGARKKKSKK